MFSSLLLAVLTLIFLALLLFHRYQAPSPPDQSKPQPSYPQQQPRQARGPNNAVNEGDAINNLSTVHLTKHFFSFKCQHVPFFDFQIHTVEDGDVEAEVVVEEEGMETIKVGTETIKVDMATIKGVVVMEAIKVQ